MFIRIVAPHFVAGIEPGVHAAPIIQYMLHWPLDRIMGYCRYKHWRVEITDDTTRTDA